ncbi:MAG TPA: AI-2E family transporter [Solirubrobacteraceae bacterium]|nr:AI-2E family transporter [Solirubrobacteraceae bacterium]
MNHDQRITPSVLYRTVFLAFGLVVAGLIFRQLATLVLGVLIVVVLAIPLAAFADLLGRFRVPRPLAVLVGLVLGLGALGALIAALVPVFSHEVNQFAANLPAIIDSLRHKLGHLTGTSPTKVGRQLQNFVNGYTHHPSKLLGPIASVGTTVAGAVAAIVVVLLTVIYTAIQPDPLLAGLTRLAPPQRRATAVAILARLREAYLGWVRGLLVGMLVLGVLTYIALRIVGLGYAAFFAILTAVAIIVPYFGALASSIPPIVYALATSPTKAILVAVVYIVIHQIEGNVIEPVVMARAVKLHPAVVAVGVVAVESLFGFVGLFVAVPILATLKILIEELWVNPQEAAQAPLAVLGSPVAALQESREALQETRERS